MSTVRDSASHDTTKKIALPPAPAAPSTQALAAIAALPVETKLSKEQRQAIVRAWYDADAAVKDAERERCTLAKMIVERVSNTPFKVSWTGDKLAVMVGRKTPTEDDDRQKYVVVLRGDEEETV